MLHRPVSFYEGHRRVIHISLAVFFLQFLIIVSLLINVRRRRLAEAALKALNETLEERVRARTDEIVQVNHDLQESEEKYRSLIERAGPGFIIVQDGLIGRVALI